MVLYARPTQLPLVPEHTQADHIDPATWPLDLTAQVGLAAEPKLLMHGHNRLVRTEYLAAHLLQIQVLESDLQDLVPGSTADAMTP